MAKLPTNMKLDAAGIALFIEALFDKKGQYMMDNLKLDYKSVNGNPKDWQINTSFELTDIVSGEGSEVKIGYDTNQGYHTLNIQKI